MKLKYRKLVARIKPLHQVIRYVMYNSGILFYQKKVRECKYDKIFRALKNSCKGKRCFIIGNGPSLTVNDLELLLNEDCFGTNEIHRIFPKTKWRPKYYLILDRYSKSTPEEIRDIESEIVFLGDYYWRFNKVLRQDAVCLHQHQDLSKDKFRFSSDIKKCIYNSPTVSFGAMQIVAYLGYDEIYLLGFDHNYSFEFEEKGNVIETGQTKAHFFKDDVPTDIIANVLGMNKTYEVAKKYCDIHKIKIINVTRGGMLKVFKRMELEDVLQMERKS